MRWIWHFHAMLRGALSMPHGALSMPHTAYFVYYKQI